MLLKFNSSLSALPTLPSLSLLSTRPTSLFLHFLKLVIESITILWCWNVLWKLFGYDCVHISTEKRTEISFIVKLLIAALFYSCLSWSWSCSWDCGWDRSWDRSWDRRWHSLFCCYFYKICMTILLLKIWINYLQLKLYFLTIWTYFFIFATFVFFFLVFTLI